MSAATQPKAKPAGTEKASKPRTRKPAVKDYSKTKEFQTVRDALQLAVASAAGAVALDALLLSQIDEYMDLWVQRQMLRDEFRAKGVTVFDERGRASENRSISLGIQTSKLMAALRKEMGLVSDPSCPSNAGPAENDEDDEL